MSVDRPPLRPLLMSLAINAALPLVAFLLIRPHVGSDALALALGGAIAAGRTVFLFARRRRVDVIGLVAITAFAISALASLAFGGSSLPLKLDMALLVGPLGLACLVSVAVGHPLHDLVTRIRRMPKANRRHSSIITAIVGCTLVVHTVVHIVLALTLPTATFLAASRLAGWGIIAVGAAVMAVYLRRARVHD
ncbi:hypothetical protein [Nonomuraea sp. CA-141351]|uniref:hypothetical protein n=1 Tax=Nonomuraea sp. CA-141351 TaxID=3239996 RepID=UPI003D8A5330